MSKLTTKQIQEIEQLAKISDSEISLSEIPENQNWADAEVGKFFRPIKKQVTIRVDMDTLEWFKSMGSKYQTRMNLALREYMIDHKKTG